MAVIHNAVLVDFRVLVVVVQLVLDAAQNAQTLVSEVVVQYVAISVHQVAAQDVLHLVVRYVPAAAEVLVKLGAAQYVAVLVVVNAALTVHQIVLLYV